jgi:hypothetical protein
MMPDTISSVSISGGYRNEKTDLYPDNVDGHRAGSIDRSRRAQSQVVSEGNGISAITGTATNQTGRELTAAFVKFNLLDERGGLVGNAMATASDLEPGQVWKFDAETPVQFATVRLSGVEVFPPR